MGLGDPVSFELTIYRNAGDPQVVQFDIEVMAEQRAVQAPWVRLFVGAVSDPNIGLVFRNPGGGDHFPNGDGEVTGLDHDEDVWVLATAVI
jgi:hypothetical protein